jgi:hypothetical protein
MTCTYRVKVGNAEISDKKTTLARTYLEGGRPVWNTTKGHKSGYNIQKRRELLHCLAGKGIDVLLIGEVLKNYVKICVIFWSEFMLVENK